MWIGLFGQHCIKCLPIQCWFKKYIYSVLSFNERIKLTFWVSAPGQKSLKLWSPASKRRTSIEICGQMNKGMFHIT